MASILDTVDVYQELLASLWKDKYKENLPEGITLALGQLKYEMEKQPLIGEPIDIPHTEIDS